VIKGRLTQAVEVNEEQPKRIDECASRKELTEAIKRSDEMLTIMRSRRLSRLKVRILRLRACLIREPACAIHSAYREAANKEIPKALLGQALTTDIGNTGSYAAARVHNLVREDLAAAEGIRITRPTAGAVNAA
jgi:hypothetical protein